MPYKDIEKRREKQRQRRNELFVRDRSKYLFEKNGWRNGGVVADGRCLCCDSQDDLVEDISFFFIWWSY